MEAMLFSQRLKRILAGDHLEGTLPDGAKLHIQTLQNEFDSFLRDFKFSYTNSSLCLLKRLTANSNLWISLPRVCEIKIEIIGVIRESENAIDMFFVNGIQNKNESSSQQLCDALQGLERKFSDIKLEILQLEAQAQVIRSKLTSIQAQVSNSCSSSRTLKLRRETQIINKKSRTVVREDDMERLVGREDDMERLLDFLIEGQPSLSSITIFGEAGLGKATLAAQVYDNIYVKNYFDSPVWVKLSIGYNFNRLLEAILKSLMPSSGSQEIMEKEDELKKTTLRDYLRNKRYLIVLIDLYPKGSHDLLYDLKGVLPDDGNGSRLLITSSYFHKVPYHGLSFSLKPLNDIESWEILTDGDFRLLSKKLQTVKRSLNVICNGRPSAIMLFRGLLLGKDKQKALPMLSNLSRNLVDNAGDYFENLPDYLKPCFLYQAVFPKIYDISIRQLYQLWIAEGFIEEKSEKMADKYLEELSMRGSIDVTSKSSRGRIKTCRLHGFWVETARRRAADEMFVSSSNYPGESFKTCKRQSIESDPAEFLSSEYSAQNLRSLLWLASEVRNLSTMDCNHVFGNSKLLKVLDLGALVFHQYPLGIENFVLLRYLKLNIPSLTSIPSSLCNLLNLYTLDMPSSHISETPFDIWKMHKLRHLNFASIKLPAHPGKYCNSLENLNFISALCPNSCTEDILARIPKLLTLRIYGDLSSHQSQLSKSLAKLLCLESLKLVNESKTPELPSIVLSEYKFPPTLPS
ncbi:hypothetical protein EZV62_009096 [Acer yangbiense]|uniref:Uncharacterized protein n=1 Tax=Acer yangbiense TaxID=1000413 RepID=A0A5C7IFC2_9ROSI|nr:hypothetical protein EZV62_009096 [Acer yangbiense]